MYLIHFIKDQKVIIKYFDNLHDSYDCMKNEFYKYINKDGGIDEDLIEFGHEVAFGHIKKKEVDEITDFYYQDKINSRDISKLFRHKHLNDIKFDPDGDGNKESQNYFRMNLVKKSDDSNVCIICYDNMVAGYDGHNYCVNHYPFPSILDD